uniref:Reverse transcriptase domain-containing protein n=1 Tax=Tanacetum cinerariifolium TaxID=118510 RepID=A0A6L2LSB5_TANCI|nr:reverse transcriptase domain-containing protein [Tanacetum cinerariifolium]
MWESAKTVAPTPNSTIVQPDVDANFVINSIRLKMIWEDKFDGYLRANPHGHIREFLAICDMFKYGETHSETVKILIFPLSLCNEAKTWFNELNEESITSDDQSKTDLKKLITKFLDGQRILNMFVKNNVNDMIIKMKQNENNFQTIYKNMERKIDEWWKSQNVSSEQTDRTEPPPPLAPTEQVNAVFTENGKTDWEGIR